MKYSVVILLLALGLVFAQKPTLTGYTSSKVLAVSGGAQDIDLYWTLDGQNINIGFVCNNVPDNGWCSFGFSPSGDMVGSDVVVAWVPTSGSGQIVDFYLADQAAPTASVCPAAVCPDSDSTANGCTSNIEVVKVERSGTYLIAEYKRPVAASDQCDVAINTLDNNNIVYAYGPTDATKTFPYNIRKHTKKTDSTPKAFNLADIPNSPSFGSRLVASLALVAAALALLL